MSETSGASIILAVYALLTPEEKDAAFTKLRGQRLADEGFAETELALYVKSLRVVAEAVGQTPGVSEYKQVAAVLIAEGREDVQPFTRLYKYFHNSWALAQEALELSGETSTKAIEARFEHRRLGKPVEYSEDVTAQGSTVDESDCLPERERCEQPNERREDADEDQLSRLLKLTAGSPRLMPFSQSDIHVARASRCSKRYKAKQRIRDHCSACSGILDSGSDSTDSRATCVAAISYINIR